MRRKPIEVRVVQDSEDGSVHVAAFRGDKRVSSWFKIELAPAK